MLMQGLRAPLPLLDELLEHVGSPELHHWPGQSPSEYSHDSPGHLQPWDQLAWPRYSKLLPLHNDPDTHVRMLVVCTSCVPPHALHMETHLWHQRELHNNTSEVSNHHLHHEEQWWDSNTQHWHYQLLTVDLEKYAIICSNTYILATPGSTCAKLGHFKNLGSEGRHLMGIGWFG